MSRFILYSYPRLPLPGQRVSVSRLGVPAIFAIPAPATTPPSHHIGNELGCQRDSDFVTENPKDDFDLMARSEKVLAQTGTRRMIMGHTRDFTGIVSCCNGKIIIIDTGISHAYGGVLFALSIHYMFTPVEGSEDTESRWIEREVVHTLYADRQEIIVDEDRELVGNFRFK
ncbi:hypothetical protein C8F01DRAFT_1343543 [Mycena amicta]|nr:hypothetical protein C8F01DRAFT_1343543 [Mycena amicta]